MSVFSEQATRRWVVDPARSTVEFRVGNFWGLTTVPGRFSRFDGSYTAGPNRRSIELIVDAASLETGNDKRDAHLRSGDFFDVEAHPHIRFTADDVMDAGDGALRVWGDLEVAGRKVPLSLEVPVRQIDGELDVEATTLVDRRLFGMTWNMLGTVSSRATLHVKARLTASGTDE
jgi:polyisoprenoid-binding protein YceI